MKTIQLTDKQLDLLRDMAEVVKDNLKLLSKTAPLTRKANVLKIAEINRLMQAVENGKDTEI